MMENRILHTINHFIITLIFISAIVIPFSIGIIEEDKTVSLIEKRELFQLPAKPQTIKAIKKFPQSFDNYYSDHFGLRNWFTKYYKLIKYYMGDSASKNVIIGKDGWLFLNSIKKNGRIYDEYGDPVGDARNANLYSQQDLKKFAQYVVALNAWLNERGIKYMLVIAPNKHSIYFEQLPDYITKINDKSATDQLFEYLKKYTDIPVVDLRAALIKEKDKALLYYKTGTHWTFMGGNIAQYEIMLEIEKLFPNQIQPEMTKLKNKGQKARDLVRMIGIHSFLKEPNPKPVFSKQACKPTRFPAGAMGRTTHTLICENQKLNAVIFRDSFFDVLEPYFSRKFKRSTYIWEKLNYPSLKKYVALEKPDIVIEEWVERVLPYVPDANQFMGALNKKRFDNSREVIFSNKAELEFNKWLNLVEDKNGILRLKSTGKDPIIIFPAMPFKPNNEYILRIDITSSVQSTLQVFYSDTKQTNRSFSEKNSIRLKIGKGDNNIYIVLDYPNLGQYLRLDPISKSGEMTIKSLEIKRVNKDF